MNWALRCGPYAIPFFLLALLYGFVPQTVREKAPAQKSSDCISESIC